VLRNHETADAAVTRLLHFDDRVLVASRPASRASPVGSRITTVIEASNPLGRNPSLAPAGDAEPNEHGAWRRKLGADRSLRPAAIGGGGSEERRKRLPRRPTSRDDRGEPAGEGTTPVPP